MEDNDGLKVSKEELFDRVANVLNRNKKTIIVVSGTPGTGKTTISNELSKKFDLGYFDLNEYAKKEGYSIEFNKKQDTHVIDTDKLFDYLEDQIKLYKKEKKASIFSGIDNKKVIVIDSHFSHDIAKEFVDICIIIKSDLKELKKRLEKRGYSKDKIDENIDCEIFDVCLNEALENGHEILVYENS